MTSSTLPSLDVPYTIETRASDGLRVLLIEVPGELSLLQVTVRAGADYEATAAERECSHFIEHLVATLLRSRGYTGIGTRSEAEEAGIAVSAYTCNDHTSYAMSGLSEMLPAMVGMLVGALTDFARCFADIVADPRWEREQQAVLQELSGRADSPDVLLYNAFHALAYAGHPRAVPQLESARNVLALTPACVLDYYRRHYVTGNLLVTVASGEAQAAVLAMLAPHTFADNDGLAPPLRLLPATDAFPRGLTVRAYPQPGAHVARLRLSWPMPDVLADSAVALSLSLVDYLLCSGTSSRLMHALRAELGAVYGVSVHAGADNTHAGFSHLRVDTSAAPDQLAAVLRVLSRELRALARYGPTPAEMIKLARNARAGRAAARMLRVPGKWVGAYAGQVLDYGRVTRDVTQGYDMMLAQDAEQLRAALNGVVNGGGIGCMVLYAGDPVALAPHDADIERAAREAFE